MEAFCNRDFCFVHALCKHVTGSLVLLSRLGWVSEAGSTWMFFVLILGFGVSGLPLIPKTVPSQGFSCAACETSYVQPANLTKLGTLIPKP